MNSGREGFTLIEMLVVLAVIGILLSIGFFSYRRYVAQQNLTEAQQSLAQALDTARSDTRRLSLDRVIRWNQGGNQLSIFSRDGTKVRDVPIANGLTIASEPLVAGGAVSSLTYSAPYGRTDTDNIEFKISGSYNMTAIVRVVGVTGKVIRGAR